jgi:DNA gyrase subunit A
MDIERDRPDLTHTDPTIRAYIEALEAELRQRQPGSKAAPSPDEPPLEPTEPPTTRQVITVSRSGLAKRTPRHLYLRQRRGGMGIFDLDTPAADPPAHLLIADVSQDILLITSLARVFRRRVRQVPEAPIRSRGQHLAQGLPLENGETVALVVPHQSGGYLTVLTAQAQVRRLRHHFFGDNMTPGNLLYDPRVLGQPIAACWSSGSDDLFVATRQGRAIRFAESLIPAKGCPALRLSDDDAVVGLAAVPPGGGVFLLTADGKGAIRLMEGFSANKAPGAGGKAAMKTDQLMGVVAVTDSDDIFAISRLSKIIRFQIAEVPPKEGVVQGVNCMALRADECVVLAVSAR